MNLGKFRMHSRPQVPPFINTVRDRLNFKIPNSSKNPPFKKLNWAYHGELTDAYRGWGRNFKFNPLKNYSNQRLPHFQICQGVETDEYSEGCELNLSPQLLGYNLPLDKLAGL